MFNPFSIFQDESAVAADIVKEAVDSHADILLIDVRTPEEYAQGHIAGSMLLPVDQLQRRLKMISDKEKTLYVYCQSGSRSSYAVGMLKQAGYTKVHNMIGGIAAWQRSGYLLEK